MEEQNKEVSESTSQKDSKIVSTEAQSTEVIAKETPKKKNRTLFYVLGCLFICCFVCVVTSVAVYAFGLFGINQLNDTIREAERISKVQEMNLEVTSFFNEFGTYPSTDLVRFSTTSIKILEPNGKTYSTLYLKRSSEASTSSTSNSTAYCYESDGNKYALAYQKEDGTWSQFGTVGNDCQSAVQVNTISTIKNFSTEDAIDFNDKLIKTQTDILAEFTKYQSFYTLDQALNQIDKSKSSINTLIQKAEGIEVLSGGAEFKDAGLELFNFYYEALDRYIVEYLNATTLEESEKIGNEFAQVEKQILDKFVDAQKEFAKEHNFNLLDEKDLSDVEVTL